VRSGARDLLKIQNKSPSLNVDSSRWRVKRQLGIVRPHAPTAFRQHFEDGAVYRLRLIEGNIVPGLENDPIDAARGQLRDVIVEVDP
jgi:hypothetical protein